MRKTLFLLALATSACSTAQEEASFTEARISAEQSTPIVEAPIERCMNLGSALEARYEGEWGYTVRWQDLALIRGAGFDTVRLPVKWSAHTAYSPPYTIETPMLERVDEIIGWAEAIGLNIIVNVHHYEELNRDPDKHEPRLEAIWDQLAAYFADKSDRVIFETINEPHSNMTVERTDALNRRLMQRIRVDNPDRWVILGTANWGTLPALQESEPSYDPRAILTWHHYLPFEFTHQGAPWSHVRKTGIRWGTRADRKAMNADLDAAFEVSERERMPIFVGEFGVYERVPVKQRALWTSALRIGMEQRGFSWCYWDYAGSLKVYDVETESWLPEIKSALLD